MKHKLQPELYQHSRKLSRPFVRFLLYEQTKGVRMNFEQLEAFKLINDFGTISAAAEKLNTTQANVSSH